MFKKQSKTEVVMNDSNLQPTRTYSGVYEDLFAEEIMKEESSSIEVNCANWSVDLK